MFCSECGKKLTGNNEFCGECQILKGLNLDEGILKKEEFKETKPRNKKTAIISITAASVVLIMTLGFFGLKYFQNNQSEKALQRAQLKEMQQVLDESNIDLDELIISQADHTSYKLLLKELQEDINHKDTTNYQTYIEDVEKYKLEFVNSSQEAISEKLAILQAMDTGAAFAYEEEAIKQYKEDMDKLVLEGKYASAQKIGVEWEEFGRGFLTTQDYQMLVSQIDTGDYPKVKLFLQIKNLATGETININKFDKFSLTEDISGSMQYDIDHVKNVMKDFLGYMQFNTGDRA
ncbi:MAG TPA: zinc ribbon domain-containing protein [Epulopiscium sp.]|nr:zinc ribbon domain-containing protein [Candidatus Epulonipiscium sp.]